MLHVRLLLTATVGLVTTLLLATSAHAIPYFEGVAFGFDNSTLMLAPDFVIPVTATFDCVEAGTDPCPGSPDVSLEAVDSEINDTAGSIDRTITWTLINNADVTDFMVFFTALGPTPHDYSNATIDIEIDGVDPMQIFSFGPYFFAGYHLNIADFALVNGRLEATKVFRYTVDEPQQNGFPPALGIASVTVPEPATGLLFGGALLMVAGAGRGKIR